VSIRLRVAGLWEATNTAKYKRRVSPAKATNLAGLKWGCTREISPGRAMQTAGNGRDDCGRALRCLMSVFNATNWSVLVNTWPASRRFRGRFFHRF
jgi:hypothetical protein